ncbi:hypothetical protein BC826DRAFT_1046244 [Russula brevipes]|nr:hypothetical protein BC826DRAFT_1046244 [Russula brevipes]
MIAMSKGLADTVYFLPVTPEFVRRSCARSQTGITSPLAGSPRSTSASSSMTSSPRSACRCSAP